MISLNNLNEEEDPETGFTSLGQDDLLISNGPMRLKPDGSFEIKNVPSGRYDVDFLSDFRALNDSYVESVVVGTKDATDTGLNVTGATLVVDVTLSSGVGRVDGTVTTDKGEMVPNATVVAVPDPKLRKHPGRYSRVSTDQSGHFSIRGLRPGEYKLLAWETLENDEYLDPEFLAPFENKATVTKIEKDTHQNVSLKVIPSPSGQP